ncbi:MAG: glycosyltransferase [Terriglobales bacterium]
MENTDGLETTLLSVLERRPDGCEVLVVLNVPYNDPYGLQGEIQILQAPSGSNLVECINLGIFTTSAPIVHVLAAGYEVDTAWVERALKHFEDPRVAAVAPGVYYPMDRGTIIAAGVPCDGNRKRIVQRNVDQSAAAPLAPTLQAAFYRRSALEAFGGGLPTAVGDKFADIDLAESLHQANWLLKSEPECRVFGSAGEDSIAGGFTSGFTAERFYWRHSPPRGIMSRLTHLPQAITDSMRCKPLWKAPAELAGRLTAICQYRHYRRHRQMLATSTAAALAAQGDWLSMQKMTANNAASPTVRLDSPHAAIKPSRLEGQRRRTQRQRK